MKAIISEAAARLLMEDWYKDDEIEDVTAITTDFMEQMREDNDIAFMLHSNKLTIQYDPVNAEFYLD